MATPVYLEVGEKRVFACAVDWPGWSRSGKGEDAALEALAAYAPRFGVVAAEAGVSFPRRMAEEFEVVERLPGTATTDFGAPGQICQADRQRLTAAQARRQAGMVAAAWAVFDRVVAAAPAELRKGPRGGGRDRDKMVEHVVDAETAYARKLGVRGVTGPALRAAIVDVLTAARDAEPVAGKGWPPRYAARRIAWHVLDHAWEMEDRREQAQG
jgi:hypothetical protein